MTYDEVGPIQRPNEYTPRPLNGRPEGLDRERRSMYTRLPRRMPMRRALVLNSHQ
jgi:hypothetical protein